ncbi:unnamed protein product, partial [Scytosiphon promiscuus]
EPRAKLASALSLLGGGFVWQAWPSSVAFFAWPDYPREMSALVQGFILYASTFIVLVGACLLWDVWRHKNSFEIAARSPVLLCLAGSAHVALVFLQMTAGVLGSGFPCSLKIWASYITFGTISMAYLLRAARLVVVYDRELRRRFQRLVKPAIQRKAMAATLVPCCLISLVVQLRFAGARQRAGKCYFFEERWSIFLPMTLLYLIAMAAMANKLKGACDAFNIRNEIVYVCVATAIASAARTVHISLAHTSWWSDRGETFPPTVHDLFACSATLYISFYKPLRDFYGAGNRRSRGIHSARRIYSGDEGHGHDATANNHHRQTQKGSGPGDDKNPETWGVLRMLRDETLRGLLVNFCEQSLCGESVDFLVDVAINYESLTRAEEQFRALTKIVENYLAQGSANEVNVSNAYRTAAAVWLTKRDEFFAMEEETRAHVLDRQRDEIAKMLAENLLTKFKQTPMTITALRALKEVAAADETTGEGSGGGQDRGMRIMLQASAAIEVARIQRITRVGEGAHPAGVGGAGGLKPRLMGNGPKAGSGDALDEISFDGSDSFDTFTLESSST